MQATLVLVAAAMLLAACRNPELDASRPAERRSWVFDSARTGDPDIGEVAVAFYLEGGQIRVTMSCNGGFGDYAWDGDRLVIAHLATTLAGCGDDEAVGAVTAVLRNRPLVTVDGSLMTLVSGSTTMVFREIVDDRSVQQSDLEGTWTVLTPNGADPHVNPLTVDATGTYRVIAGCQDMSGQLAVVDGRLTALKVAGGPVAAPDCVHPIGAAPPDKDPVQQVVSAAHLRRTDTGLEALDTTGKSVAVLRRTGG